MLRTNTVHVRVGASGLNDYVVDVGSILIDNEVITLGKLLIPLSEQSFFTLPEERGKYAVVNAYYNYKRGNFVFDRVLVSDKFVPNYTAKAISNLIPLAQFVLKQSAGGFVVEAINEYSRVATYSIGIGGETGERGLQGPIGSMGWAGHSGSMGCTGMPGSMGHTGCPGPTGVGLQGYQGSQGCTGVYPDPYLLLHLKFKSDEPVQTDYSIYERDFTWSVTGMGVTGSNTGSFYTRETGIVDNCHSVEYRGDEASYRHDEYLDFYGFTGVIQAWVRVNVPPKSEFTYTGVQGSTGMLRFTEACTYLPGEWAWYVDDTLVSTSRIFTRAVPSGEYLGSITSRKWILGDGTVVHGNLTSVIHTYEEPGIYNVILIVEDSLGIDSRVRNGYVVVNAMHPEPAYVVAEGYGYSNDEYWCLKLDDQLRLVFEDKYYTYRSVSPVVAQGQWALVEFHTGSEQMYVGTYNTPRRQIDSVKTVNVNPPILLENATYIAPNSSLKIDDLKVWLGEKNLSEYYYKTRAAAGVLDR